MLDKGLKETVSRNIKNSLQKKTQCEQIDNIDHLFERVQKHHNVLCMGNNVQANANALIEKLSDANTPVFYLHRPEQIFQKRHLSIQPQGDVHIIDNSLLESFIATVKDGNCAIIIDWSAFNSKQMLALNTILDKNPTIDGFHLPQHTHIISLSDKAFNDPAFLSRHQAVLSHQASITNNPQGSPSQPNIIDLEGVVDWKQKLFGSIKLIGDTITWEKSAFCDQIQQGQHHFLITNMAKDGQKTLLQEVSQAKASGALHYHGYAIPIPKHFQIDFSQSEFDFSQFSAPNPSTVLVQRNVSYASPMPKDVTIVNTHLFDHLIKRNFINEEGKYVEREGSIKEHQDQDFNLFITSPLSKAQYYCLFHEAQKYNVSLHLFLSPQVTLPAQVNVTTMPAVADLQTQPKPKGTIIATNDAQKALKDVLEKNDIYAVIDVEDYNYAQLFESMQFDRTAHGYQNFREVKSEFLEKLSEGKKIVLKGEFPEELLLVLHCVLCSSDEKYAAAKENLLLIVEDKTIEKGQAQYKALDFLGKDYYAVQGFDVSKDAKQTSLPFIEDDQSTAAIDLTNSAVEAAQFMERRKAGCNAILSNHSMLQLVGHSGVGKSHFMAALGVKVYDELSSFEQWAKDDSDQMKVLFIDESNIEDSHLTTFSPLKHLDGSDNLEQKVKLLHNKKFYDIGKNHKVVFARNPENYSASRSVQKLFEQDIPVMYFKDFSPSYIYEKLLKEPIYNRLSETIQSHIPEEQFKDISKALMLDYQQFNKDQRAAGKDTACKTVRELQEQLLQSIKDIAHPLPYQPMQSDNFISTQATQPVEQALSNFIDIRKMQKEGDFGPRAVGLNAFVISGDAGIGKTELIRTMLATKNIVEGNLDSSSKAHQYYKIEASMPIEQKKKIITKAFEEGNVVWIDEVNSCSNDDGLEKILNAALTGKHPDSQKLDSDDVAINPGFMMISSINSALWAGRSQLSPAIKHRSVMCQAKSLHDYTAEDLQHIVEHQLKQTTLADTAKLDTICSSIASSFKDQLSSDQGKFLSLRDLNTAVPQAIANITSQPPEPITTTDKTTKPQNSEKVRVKNLGMKV